VGKTAPPASESAESLKDPRTEPLSMPEGMETANIISKQSKAAPRDEIYFKIRLFNFSQNFINFADVVGKTQNRTPNATPMQFSPTKVGKKKQKIQKHESPLV
jgi:hypothetical protein